jgi:hypothetical protein
MADETYRCAALGVDVVDMHFHEPAVDPYVGYPIPA